LNNVIYNKTTPNYVIQSPKLSAENFAIKTSREAPE